MHPSSAVGLFAAATTVPGPQFTELVRVRPNAHSPSWPPVLIFCVMVVAFGALFAAVVFLRRARHAGHAASGPLDG
jgi:hypothetical protein